MTHPRPFKNVPEATAFCIDIRSLVARQTTLVSLSVDNGVTWEFGLLRPKRINCVTLSQPFTLSEPLFSYRQTDDTNHTSLAHPKKWL